MKLRSFFPAALIGGLFALTAFARGPVVTAKPTDAAGASCPSGTCCLMSAATAPAAAQPETCVVSGDKLGEMGKPFAYVYKVAGRPDRTVMLCCKDCVKDFEKEPAKYLAKLDAAAAAAAKK